MLVFVFGLLVSRGIIRLVTNWDERQAGKWNDFLWLTKRENGKKTKQIKARLLSTVSVVLSSVPGELADWGRAPVDSGHGWRVGAFGLPAALRYCLSNTHSLGTNTHAHNQSNTQACYVQPRATSVRGSTHKPRPRHRQYVRVWSKHALYSQHCHTSLPVFASPTRSDTQTVLGELRLKNKSMALSWQQCVFVWAALPCFLLGCAHKESLLKEGLMRLLVILAVWEKQTLKRHLANLNVSKNKWSCSWIKSLLLHKFTLFKPNARKKKDLTFDQKKKNLGTFLK